MVKIDRERFCEIMKRFDKDKCIITAFENNGCLFKSDNYIFINEWNGDVSIIDQYTLDNTPKLINWYKLYHLGRCLNVYGFNSELDICRFIFKVIKELKENGLV